VIEIGSPVIFDITYTPYKPRKDFNDNELKKWQENRVFYNMTGTNNIYGYMVKEEKQMKDTAVGFTMLNYFEKSTGVFNENGMITTKELKEMKERARVNEGNFWHGFISFNEEDSSKIDHVEKCFDLIKKTFPPFFKRIGFKREDIDLMCGLHLDTKNHFHVHYCFWEKYPLIKNPRASGYIYRKKGKIPKETVLNMTKRVNEFVVDKELEEKREEAIDELKMHSGLFFILTRNDIIKKEVLKLAKELPQDKPLWYSNREMEPFRRRIDNIVEEITQIDDNFRQKDIEFKKAMVKAENRLRENAKDFYEGVEKDDMFYDRMIYKEQTDVKEIRSIERLRNDYKRRLGNILLRKISYIQKNSYKYDGTKKHKSNDKTIKKRLAISRRKIGKSLNQMLESFCTTFELVRDKSNNRLQELEEEIATDYLMKKYEGKQAIARRKQREQEEEYENVKEEIYKDNQNYNSR